MFAWLQQQNLFLAIEREANFDLLVRQSTPIKNGEILTVAQVLFHLTTVLFDEIVERDRGAVYTSKQK